MCPVYQEAVSECYLAFYYVGSLFGCILGKIFTCMKCRLIVDLELETLIFAISGQLRCLWVQVSNLMSKAI